MPDDILRAAWELAKMGPTSANCSPMRATADRDGSLQGVCLIMALKAPGVELRGDRFGFVEARRVQ